MDFEIPQGSSPAIRNALDLFSLPPSDISVINSNYNVYFPISSYKENKNPLQFVIGSSSTHLLDLQSSFLYLKVKILQENGQAITADHIVAPSTNFFASLFSGIDVSFNGTLVSRSTSFYPFRHHIQDLICNGDATKNCQLTSQLFYPDLKQDKFDSTNAGFVKRKEFCNLSAPFEVIGPIAESVFQSSRYFPTNVEVKLSLSRSSPNFCLVGSKPANSTSTSPFQVVFDEVALYVKRVLVSPQVLAYHSKLLSSGKRYQYPLRSQECKSFAISKDTLSVVSETLFSGSLPEFLVLGFVDALALVGSLDKSPFNFQNFNLQSVVISIDGEAATQRTINFDADKNVSLLGWKTLFTALPFMEMGNGIPRDGYLDGNFLLVFDIMPGNTANRLQIKKQGQIKVELKFKTPITKSVNCIVLAQFESLLQVDSNKNIFSEASVQF